MERRECGHPDSAQDQPCSDCADPSKGLIPDLPLIGRRVLSDERYPKMTKPIRSPRLRANSAISEETEVEVDSDEICKPIKITKF